MMYIKTIDGIAVKKTRQEIVVIRDGMVTYNPTHEQIIADGWEEYHAPAISAEAELMLAKSRKRNEVLFYDSSAEVNGFSIGGVDMWLDKSTRAGLLLRFQAEVALGNEMTALWFGGNEYPLPLAVALQMLYALEVYASQCYDNTQRHLAEVMALSSIEEVEAYDVTKGYPEKLKF
jgi:hypothetical protein